MRVGVETDVGAEGEIRSTVVEFDKEEGVAVAAVAKGESDEAAGLISPSRHVVEDTEPDKGMSSEEDASS